MAKRKIPLFVVCLFICLAFSAELSRIAHILHFLSANVGTEAGNVSLRLHPAYYGAEVLNTLAQHPGYIQKSILLTSDYTYKLGTFVSSLQVTNEADGDFGGFQSFTGEKKDFEVFEGEYVCTVVNSYLAGRVLEISDSGLGGNEHNLKKIDSTAALRFLAKSRTSKGLYALYPGSEQVSLSSLYYGNLAWELYSRHTTPAQSPSPSAAVLAHVKELFKDGGFRAHADVKHADLQSTFQAVSLLKALDLWDTFASQNRKATEDQIQKFVLSHKDEATHAFFERKGLEPDVASTYWAVAVANKLGFASAVDTNAVTRFVASLQRPTDGGFRLRASSPTGHFANTFYALQTLELLKTVPVLEETLAQEERVILAPQYIPSLAISVSIVLVLVVFAGVLYLLPRTKDDESNEGAQATEKKKKDTEGKKKKKEPQMTIIRNKATKECVDKDGIPYPIDSLNKKEWDVVSTKETETHTIYVLKKKDTLLKQKLRESPGARRK